jgi:hypothetical protein
MIREIVMEERLVSAEAIVRYIKSSARLTTPMATLMARIECDLDWLMIQMEREDQDRAMQMADAYGDGAHALSVWPEYKKLEDMPEIKEEGF